MRCLCLAVAVAPLLLALPAAAPAQPKRRAEPLVERVRKGIDGGVAYLRRVQRGDGSWEDVGEADQLLRSEFRGGATALTLLALLNAGVPKNDPAIVKGLKYLRGIESGRTYVRALQTMALAEAGLSQDRELIQRNADWLIEAQVYRGGNLQGWGYTQKSIGSDNSNTQYALLGLWAARQAGIPIKRAVWEGIRAYYVRSQNEDGSWIYASGIGAPEWGPQRSATMTTAGLCGLLITGMELNPGREERRPDGSTANCGVYVEDIPAAKALHWLGKNFTVALDQRVFYHLYGIERAGRLSGLRFLGEHDWYREGCAYLAKNQRTDGSWHVIGTWDRWPAISTSFALLFLSKGRTPVLMSKIVHGRWPRQPDDADWNNDRNDLRHFVPFAGKQLYKDVKLAWQTFDLMRAAHAQPGFDGNLSEDQAAGVVAELLQSPIAYISGHESPRLRFTAAEKALLRRYVENGGFIFAEACCGKPEFDRGFKALVEEVWGQELEPLSGTHPVWTSHFAVPPGEPYKLYGLQIGCRTALIYSPQDVSCWWEGNRTDDGRGQLAFRLGVNVVAYATGREPPRPRLTPHTVVREARPPGPPKRGAFEAGQLFHRGGDWQPAPRAMTNLLEHVEKEYGVPVKIRTRRVNVTDDGVKDVKFLYLHGRDTFKYAPAQLADLRFNLENGGLLLADAACGKVAFDKSFRIFVKDLFPGKELERVPPDDPLFGARLNGGAALTERTIRLRARPGGTMQAAVPFLEGVRVNGRWALLYSKYDLGCALERGQSSDCMGYDPDSALRIASAAVLYQLTPNLGAR